MSDFAVSTDDGWIDAGLAAELPGLRLATVAVACVPGASSPGLREQLRHLSDRMTGARAVRLRREAVPSAYRVFFRLVGLDPDATPVPAEQAARDRLANGDYRSAGLVDDALLLALVETGVPVYAVDAATLAGPLGVRPARAGERLGGGPYAPDLVPGRLVLADAERPVGVLFGAIAPEHRVTDASRALRLVAIGVAGVPQICVEEALHGCAEALRAG